MKYRVPRDISPSNLAALEVGPCQKAEAQLIYNLIISRIIE